MIARRGNAKLAPVSFARDTPARSLEDQLAEIVQEVPLRGEAAERRRLDEIEAARQKRIRWEAAMDEARVQYAEVLALVFQAA
ncbi:hypothetical protein ACFY8W_37715 [Streptomyces sp. NPDC012637]|uniref:hypothetical protein n=1 Tax=Streptomyces sp. NPDC012637 TaxID=3364842 RepID=UPI0036F0382D